MGLFSFIGGILGGNSAKKASRAAEAAQVDYLNRALDETTRQFDITRSDYQPFRTAGLSALSGYGDLAGINGAGQQDAAIQALRESPLYASLFNNGLEVNLQNASATGGLRGGDQVRSLADFGADTLSATIMQQLGTLGNLVGVGQGATDSTAAFGAAKANEISQLLSNIGGVKSNAILTRGGINARNWSNAGSFLDGAAGAALGGVTPGGILKLAGRIF